MSSAFITGTVTVNGKPAQHVTVASRTVQFSVLDGAFIGVVAKTGSYALTAHVPGAKPVTKKVAIAKLNGSAKSVDFKIKAKK